MSKPSNPVSPLGAGSQAAGSQDTHPDTSATVDCVVVGGGPAGIMIGLLLALRDVKVMVLESHPDFDRDFRGDTIHPSTLEILDQIGLADGLLELPHGKIQEVTFHTAKKALRMIDLHHLKSKYPYIAMMPQARFLAYLVEHARKLASFSIVMKAEVRGLVEEGGTIRGVTYRGDDGKTHEVRAKLTVAADGRFSRIRHIAGLEPKASSPPMDVLWFRLPKKEGDHAESGSGFISGGKFVIVLDRDDQWQVALVYPKGGYQEIKAAGMDVFRNGIVEIVPWFADRIDTLSDWKQCSVLAVESNRLDRWHKPGLLFIGDSAHTMSPVGGVGINYAIQDAVVAANLLAEPIKQGAVPEATLAQIQRLRERPVAIIQAIQTWIQKRVVSPALASKDREFQFPFPLRLIQSIPGLRSLPGKMVAFGPTRVRVEDPRKAP